MLLVDSPTNDAVEIAVSFLKECGEKLTKVSAKGVNAIFDILGCILHDNKVNKRVSCILSDAYENFNLLDVCNV